MNVLRFCFPLFFIAIGFSILFGTTVADSKKLPQTSLSLGKHQLHVELALNEASREQGLMNKKSLGDNEGMLFVFPHPQPVSFWMKNTSLPLSIAYISSNGHILEIHDLEPFNERSVFSSSSAIVYVLEVPRGWFEEHHVFAGDEVRGLPFPTIAK